MRRPDANLQSFTLSNQEIIAGRAWVTAVLSSGEHGSRQLWLLYEREHTEVSSCEALTSRYTWQVLLQQVAIDGVLAETPSSEACGSAFLPAGSADCGKAAQGRPRFCAA